MFPKDDVLLSHTDYCAIAFFRSSVSCDLSDRGAKQLGIAVSHAWIALMPPSQDASLGSQCQQFTHTLAPHCNRDRLFAQC
jgi:hypothetical protein